MKIERPSANLHDSGDFMALVRVLCQLLGIRQRELADSLGLKPAQMNLYFQGKVEMRADRMITLLRILGVDIEKQLHDKILEAGGEGSVIPTNKILASMGALDEGKRRSLLKIIKILGTK